MPLLEPFNCLHFIPVLLLLFSPIASIHCALPSSDKYRFQAVPTIVLSELQTSERHDAPVLLQLLNETKLHLRELVDPTGARGCQDPEHYYHEVGDDDANCD